MSTKKTFALSTAIAALLSATAVSTSSAAMITWNPAANITGENNVSVYGELVGAFNVGDTGVAPTTLNTVPFASFPVPSGIGTFGSATGVAPFGSVFFDLTTGLGGFASTNTFFGPVLPAVPFSSLSAPYQTLLESGTQTAAASDSISLLLFGLTPGQQYEFQTWVNFSTGGPFPSDVMVSSVDGGSVTLIGNTSPSDMMGAPVDGGLGQFATGIFTADDIFQGITYSGVGGSFAQVNAFQLRAIPEPSTVLFGLALAGVCFGGRRRAKQESLAK